MRLRRSRLLLGALTLLATVSDAGAEVIDATLTTLIEGRRDPRDGNLYSSVPLYEQVTLSIGDVRLRHVDDVTVVVRGWGQLQLAGDYVPAIGGGTGDLDVGFVEGKLLGRRLTLRLGRQLVFAGAARAQPIDGASATVRIWRHIAANVYGGVPVTYRFGVHQGDAIAGGRLSWRPSWDSEVGASFVEMVDRGRQARQDLGADARWRPLRMLTLEGYALLSLLELRLAEANLAATLQPRPSLQLAADYRRTSPDLFLPRGSILSVFSQASRDEAGAFLFWSPLPRLRVEGDWHAVVDDFGFGQRGGARVSASLGPAFETTVAAELRVLRLGGGNGYVQGRLFAIQRLSTRLVVTADVDAYGLEQPINGQSFSVTGAATLGWDLSPHWRAVVAAIADSTPLVQARFECMAKLVWNQTFRIHQVRP
jgi:hypothetical protein